MLSSTDSTHQPGLKAGDVFDPVSKNIFSFVDGSLQVKGLENGVISEYHFPNLVENQVTNFNPLKFKKTNQSNIIVSPSGHTLTCKS